MMDTAIRALLMAAVSIVGLAVLATAGFVYSIHPPRYTSLSNPTSVFGWPFEEVSLRTEDDLQLAAWLIPSSNDDASRSAVVVLHGYPYSKGDVLGITPFLHDKYDLLLLDLRYFGDSGGAITTLGYREWRDLAAAVRFLRDRGYTSLGVWGVSLGASVALISLAHNSGIDAVVADSPYSDLHEMTLDYYRRFPILAPALAAITELLARAFLGVAPADVSPAKAVAISHVPIFLIHGADDRTIPMHHHERLRAALHANADVETWIINGADHGQTYAVARPRYESRLADFFARHLG